MNREFYTQEGIPGTLPGSNRHAATGGRAFLDALQAALPKINLQGLSADLALQLRDGPVVPRCFPRPGNTLPDPLANLTHAARD
jgi:hypothetical protein